MLSRNYFFILFFHFIPYVILSNPADSVEVTIKAPFYKGSETNFICSKVSSNSIQIRLKLDSLGVGRIKIPVSGKKFWRMVISDANEFNVLIDKNYRLYIFFDKKNIPSFSGQGAAVNNYLVEDELLAEAFDTKVNNIERQIEKVDFFLKIANTYQGKFNMLYKQYYTSIHPDKELDYILQSINQSYILNQKQSFLNDLGIIELKLEQRFELDKSNLLNDTILIEMENYYSLGNFGEYLTNYRNYYFLKTSGPYESDKETINQLFIRDFKSISNNPFYSLPVKKEQLFKELYMNFFISPLSPVLDSIFISLKKNYPSDTWIKAIDLVYKRKMHLAKGNVAPPLQGIDTMGRITTLEDFKGKIVFIDSWATWCSGCVAALPHVFEIQKHFEGNPDVKFIFLSHDGSDKGKWLRYLNNHPEFQGIHLLLPKDDKLSKAWDGLGTPQYIVIDKNGKIVNAFAETLTAIKEIEEALNK